MNEALEEWLDYCGGRIDRDSCNLLGLFKSGLSVEELDLAFAPFPHADQMKVRLMKVLGAGELGNYLYLQPQRRGSTEALGQAAKAWLVEQARFCLERGNAELHQLASNAVVILVDKEAFYAALMEDHPGSCISDFLSDEVIRSYGAMQPSIYGLAEALYGLAADYNLCWYVMQPLLSVSIDFSIYYDFWRMGGQSLLNHQGLLVRTD
jgi:hypothetical protein